MCRSRAAPIAYRIESRPKRQSNRMRTKPCNHRGSDYTLASTRCGLRNDSRDSGLHGRPLRRGASDRRSGRLDHRRPVGSQISTNAESAERIVHARLVLEPGTTDEMPGSREDAAADARCHGGPKNLA